MSRDNRIEEFIQKSLDAGIPMPSFIGLLTARGWTEKQAYSALADHYQSQAGIEVPPRPSSGASARDAFFYLLIFSTLAVWTLSLGCLAFSLIDRWLSDPLFRGYGETFNTYTVTMSLAAVIVAFPLYLLISRVVLREAAADPDKLESSIRKWLTYMALVVAASVFMGDLITALAYLLRGELTSRFLAKSFVVLGLSSGVFWYYFGGLRKIEIAMGRFSRDRFMAAASACGRGDHDRSRLHATGCAQCTAQDCRGQPESATTLHAVERHPELLAGSSIAPPHQPLRDSRVLR